MSARNTAIHLITKAGILLGALFLVGVLLAAIPAHKSQPAQTSEAQESQSTQSNANTMPGMDMSDEHTAEAGAMHDMASGIHDAHSLHMHMPAPRPQSPADVQRANEIVTQLRGGIEKYKDYHVALDEGFEIFMPDTQQPEYHFTSYKNGFLGALNFDPSRPTSLLYKKLLAAMNWSARCTPCPSGPSRISSTYACPSASPVGICIPISVCLRATRCAPRTSLSLG